MSIAFTAASHRRRAALMAAAACLSLALAACNTSSELVTATVPDDYRLRHPIAIQERNQSLAIFVGQGRGGLTLQQRSDVAALARTWQREGTGGIVVDVPADTVNARAAADAYRDIHATLTAGGVPSHAITRRHYQPDDPRQLAAVKVNYPRMAAVAGPCGLWPEDLGPNTNNPGYNDNQHYANFGCATQRNLAAMIDNPADLEQPRSETSVYTARRTAAFEKYRKGEPTAIDYPAATKAKLSEIGK